MTAELAERDPDVQQAYEVDVLKRFKAGEVMDEKPAMLRPDVPVARLATSIVRTGDAAAGSPIANGGFEEIPGDVGSSTDELVVGHLDERLFDAVVRMADHDVEQLPIVDRDDDTELLEWLDSQDHMTTALRKLEKRAGPRGRQSQWIRPLDDERGRTVVAVTPGEVFPYVTYTRPSPHPDGE